MTVYTISPYKQVLKIYISSSLFLQKVMKICFEFSKLYDIKKWQNNFFLQKMERRNSSFLFIFKQLEKCQNEYYP